MKRFMLLTQKKTCNKCVAAKVLEGNPSTTHCELGYAVRTAVENESAVWIPLEPCVKPTSNNDLIYARKWFRADQMRRQ